MLTICCFASLVLVKGAYTQNSHYGEEFVLGMIPNYKTPNQIILDIASKEDGHVNYSIPYLNILQNTALKKGQTSIIINGSLATYGNFTEERGIHISTNVPVAVIMTAFYENNRDSYLALPISTLGLHYRAASYTPLSGERNDAAILIVAVHNNTNVLIKGFGNTNTSVDMNRLSVHQISSIHYDLTNVEIIASKVVAVISGTLCAQIPQNITPCGMLMEEMVPVEAWMPGTFVVPPFYSSNGFLLRFLTDSNSKICLRNNTRTLCNSSHYFSRQEFLMGTEPVVVTSSGRISVVQYGLGHGYYNNDGAPYMIIIPSIENYLNEYYFVLPTVYGSFISYLSVTVPSAESSGLLLDGSSPTAIHRYTVPFINYTVLVFDIGLGYHILKHSNAYVKFGAFVYGRGPYTAYGFPLGFHFLAFASTPTSLTTTASEIATTPSLFDKICYSCDDMSHVELCDTVHYCPKNEICFIESYVKSGRKAFLSGCISSSLCYKEATKNNSERCVECCDHDYCNNKGCGESGIPPREQRGPHCYDCHHVWSPDECNTVALCEHGQVCSIEEFKWGDHSHFKLGCTNGLCNPISRSLQMALRSLPVCHHCCRDDYCNINCTRSTTNEGSVIIG